MNIVSYRKFAEPVLKFGRASCFAIISCGLMLAGMGGCAEKPDNVAEPAPVGGPPLLRRLTESQYRASVSDIFGADIPVVGRFEKGLRSHGLIAVGSSEAGISPFTMEQYDNAAQGVADAVLGSDKRGELVPCTPRSATEFDAACARTFVEHYGKQLFRRPLAEDQIKRYIDVASLGASQLGDFYEGLKYALVGMMTSPQFLLRIEHTEPSAEHDKLGQLDAYSKATRLSFFLTDSTPDQELLRAAQAGELDSREGLARQVDRLIASSRFEGAVRAFFQDMLEFDLFDSMAKDAEIYPAFNSQVALDAQEQTLRDIVDHLIAQDGDYRDLFTLKQTFMTRSLGVVYQQPVATRNGWQRTDLSYDGSRLGIQSHISFVALHSHPGRSSPTLRGEAIRNVFLCQEVPDPPADVDFSAVQDASSADMPTARHRLAVHNSEPACAGCHKVMDPVGLALENYDGLGSFRTHENGVQIDGSGFLDGISYDDPQGLASALRNHFETPRCVVERMYRFAVGRDTVWDERSYMDYLIETFAADGYRVPDLMRVIALSKNFFAISETADSKGDYAQADSIEKRRNPS